MLNAWRVTLKSNQGDQLQIASRKKMAETVVILQEINPCYGTTWVELSPYEVKEIRARNLEARKSGTHVQLYGMQEID